MNGDSNALAEGFYWYAEKLMWGYENVTPNPEEALPLLSTSWITQSRAAGVSDCASSLSCIHRVTHHWAYRRAVKRNLLSRCWARTTSYVPASPGRIV
jgi:hypothetical protein